MTRSALGAGRDLGRSLAKVLAICVNGNGMIALQKNLAGSEITHSGHSQVGSRVDAMEVEQDEALGHGRDKTEIKLAVVQFGLRQHSDAASVLRSIADGGEQNRAVQTGLLAAGVIAVQAHDGRAIDGQRSERGEHVASVPAQPARHAIGAPVGLSVDAETGDSTEVDRALLFGAFFRMEQGVAREHWAEWTRGASVAAIGIGEGRGVRRIGRAGRGVGHGVNRP